MKVILRKHSLPISSSLNEEQSSRTVFSSGYREMDSENSNTQIAEGEGMLTDIVALWQTYTPSLHPVC